MSSADTRQLPPRGLPILSGPPPVTESSTCWQCAKEFNVLWRRKHACGHCGYEYCSACMSDGQALMPRRAGQASTSTGSGALAEIKDALGIEERKATIGGGYEVESVCLYCLAMLQVTAAPLPILRSLPLKRLKEYLAAYNIPCIGPKEKEDFVQAVIKARSPTTGCLSPEAESYYRRRSVPKQGQFPTRLANGTSPSAATPRPRPQPAAQARPSPQSYARPPPPTYARPPQASPSRPHPPTQARPPPPQSQPRPAPSSAPRPSTPARQPSPPVPTILSLVSLPNSYLASLSIGTLKAILYENHVRVDFKQVLEKNELIGRVSELVADERKRLERQRVEEERLANPVAVPAAAPPPAPAVNGDKPSDSGADLNGEPVDGPVPIESAAKVSVPTGPMPEIDRGLCVVCQDEEATLAVVDCGHLCMCPRECLSCGREFARADLQRLD